jgi:gluconokinase
VLACTVDGRVVAEGTEFYGLQTPQPGYVEQDADDVYAATMRVLQSTLDEVRLRGNDALAIGISSAMHGIVCVDDRGELLSPLLTWMDRRSAAVADRWREDGTGLRLYQQTGAPMHPMLPVCKLRFLSENDPALFARAHRFVGMKELLVARWTGDWMVDHGIASATGMFDLRKRAWSDDALNCAGVSAERLSNPVSTTLALRDIRPAIARGLGIDARCAVVLASSDGALANLGVGAVSADHLALTIGTSGAVRTVTTEPRFDDRGRTFAYAFDDGHVLVGGPTSSAGAVLNWVLALLLPEVPEHERFDKAISLSESLPPGANGLTALPFLSGERAPYWESRLRGSLIGLDLSHDRRHIIRALFEGVVYALYSVYEVLREKIAEPERIVLTGGVTKAPFVRQLVADIFGVPAAQSTQSEASAFGAAMMAAIGIGALTSIEDVAARVSTRADTHPDPVRQAAYAEMYADYRERVAATNPLYHAHLDRARDASGVLSPSP